MIGRARVYCCVLICLVLSVAAQESANAQTYPDPQATTPVDGDYTVTYAPNCNNQPGVNCYFTYLQEKVGASGSWANVSSGTGSISYTSKPFGTYSYRVYLGGYMSGYGYQEGYSNTITVVVADDPERDDIATQADYSYEVRQGYFDTDSRLDLFVNKVAGGDPYNGVIEKVVLLQGDPVSGVPTFSLEVPSAAEANAAAAWPLSAAYPLLKDINADGFIDVMVFDTSSAVNNAPAQIIYAPGQVTVAEPLGLKPIDDSLKQYVANSFDYFVNPDYFTDNVPVYYYQIWIWYAYCGPSYGFPSFDSYYWDYYSGCYVDYIYLSGYYADFNVFNEDAVAVWYNEAMINAGSISRTDGLDQIEQATESAIAEDGETIPIGGWPMEDDFVEEVPADPDRRRGLELIWPIIGIGDALAQEDDLDTEEAEIVVRVANTVYITAHRVIGWPFPYHLAIEHRLFPWKYSAATLSAGPNDDDKLDAEINRTTDHPMSSSNITLAIVNPPGSPGAGTPLELFDDMLQAQLNYDDNLEYCYTPEPGEGCYNSNGYVRGLVEKTSGLVTWINSIDKDSWDDFAGGEVPVPPGEFDPD